MGCDIHLFVESRQDGTWRCERPPRALALEFYRGVTPDQGTDWGMQWIVGRNYYLFAILADVRNVPSVIAQTALVPMGSPRGLPSDPSETFLGSGNPLDERYHGLHSLSYWTVEELLAYDWSRVVEMSCVITRSHYEFRCAMGLSASPPSFANLTTKELFAEQTLVLDARRDAEELRAGAPSSHVCEYWTENYAEAAGDFWTQAMPALLSLSVDRRNVRILFGFDG